MRIVIDMQGAQGDGSRHRGIGRYTLSLAKALIRNSGMHEIFLVVNGCFPEAIASIRVVMDELLPQKNIRVWYPPSFLSNQEETDTWHRNTAELLREAFFASLKPDVVLVSSLFEGFGDDVVTSIGVFSSAIPTSVILYDLIPLIHRDTYLNNPFVEAWYEQKIAHLLRSDMLLAISESSRQEAISYIGFSPDACVNISAAVEGQFYKKNIDSLCEQAMRARYGLSRQFIMYTGGIDYRKNVDGLIRAYARLPNSLRAEHQLAVVCSVQPNNRTMLMKLAKKVGLKSDELVLTGFVSDDDLLNLYNLCKMFVFPSWHEGFGLPALEAMSCGRAVIGANTSSLPEVIGKKEALFDPKSDEAIADKLIQVLTDDIFRSELEEHGLQQAKQFSWDISAQRAMAAFEHFHEKRMQQSLSNTILLSRPKLAYLSPLPLEGSEISDYSAELLPELARFYDIDVIVMPDVIASPWMTANCSVRTIDWFKMNSAQYDRVLYHFGNTEFHQHMFGLLADIPGVIVLHDFFLSGIISHMDSTDYDAGIWAKALYDGHGYPAVKDLFHATDVSEIVLRYPCNFNVLRNAQEIIVRSQHSLRLASDWYGEDAGDNWVLIDDNHTPRMRADCYVEAIETAYQREQTGISALIHSIAEIGSAPVDEQSWREAAQAIAHSIPPRMAFRQLLVDISGLLSSNLTNNDIQSVTHQRLRTLLEQTPQGFRVEPVYATIEQGYRYARRFIFDFLGCAETGLQDDVIEYRAGDVFLGLDIPSSVLSAQQAFYQLLRHHGVQTHLEPSDDLFQKIIARM
jgi:glycosyltransferase involved in cell wall biosynthesis